MKLIIASSYQKNQKNEHTVEHLKWAKIKQKSRLNKQVTREEKKTRLLINYVTLTKAY